MTQMHGLRQRMEEFGLPSTAIIVHRCTHDVTMPMGRGRKDRMAPTYAPISVIADAVSVIIESFCIIHYM